MAVALVAGGVRRGRYGRPATSTSGAPAVLVRAKLLAGRAPRVGPNRLAFEAERRRCLPRDRTSATPTRTPMFRGRDRCTVGTLRTRTRRPRSVHLDHCRAGPSAPA